MAIIRPYYKVYRVLPDPSDYFYIKNEYYGSNTISWSKFGTPNCTDLQYSYDKTTWTNVTMTGNITTMQGGDTVYFRSTTGFSKDTSNYIKLSCSQDFSTGGNLCTLLDYINADTIITIPDYAFCNMFNSITKLTNAGNLTIGNATTIGQNGLYSAFNGCTSLTTCPDLSSVTTIGQAGLNSAFDGCTSLTTPPDLSNVTSIGQGGLTSAFNGCTSLATGPDLSNVTSIDSYGLSNFFHNCYKISTVTTPNIQDLTQNNVLNNWLNNAGSQATGTKTVRVPTGATIATGSNSGIPTGWTRVDY